MNMAKTKTLIDVTKIADKLSAIVGLEHVVDSHDLRFAKYDHATFDVEHLPWFAVQPNCVQEVQALVRLANDEGWQLYPVSRGNNWGYGNAIPTGPGQIVVDLSRMNLIEEVNEKLGY